MEELIASDLPIATSLLSEMNGNMKDILSNVRNLIENLKENNYDTNKGFSLLELKNEVFLSYLMDLCYVVKRKLDGQSIQNNSAIDRLVESRVSLERLRPMEEKLKYQIEKYSKIAKEGLPKEDDPSRLSGDLDNIAMSSDEEESTGDKKQNGRDTEKVYKIPKISLTHYPGEEKSENNQNERAKKRLLNSSMFQDTYEEYTNDPTVISNRDIHKERAMKKRKEIERFEEENMTRLTLTKKQKKDLEGVSTLGNMKKEFLSFHSLDALDPNAKSSKKSKTGGGKSKKGKGKSKKGFKKRR